MEARRLLDSAEDVPEFELVRSALSLLIKDANYYLDRAEQPPEHPRALEHWHMCRDVFNDLCYCGTMTRRLANLNQLKPETISELFRERVRNFYASSPQSE